MQKTFDLSSLVAELEKLPGVCITFPCGDELHEDDSPVEDGTWFIILQLERDQAGRLSEDGWLCLEFLTWLINTDYKRDRIELSMESLPPYLNRPGNTLEFWLRGWDDYDPDELARWIAEVRDQVGFFRGGQPGSYYDFSLN